MGKKKRGHPDVEEVLARPWCYYCERDFDDLKILISHQKAKHFKCERCGRRLNTAGGLSVHMNQVHKEALTSVENALPNRQGLEVEIFGMEGIPEDIVQVHNQRVLQQFYEAEAERRAATGNPVPGGANNAALKKPKFESPSDLKKRLAEHKAKKAAQEAAGVSSGDVTPMGAGQPPQSPGVIQSPSAYPQAGSPPFMQHQSSFSGPQGSPSQPAFAQPYGQPPYQQPPPFGQQPSFNPQQQPGFGPPMPPYGPPGAPQFPPPGQSFSPAGASPFQPPFQGGPPRQFGAGSPPFHQGPHQAPPHMSQGHGLPPPQRQGSLPAAPGLPQRPSFGAPQVNAFQMQQMHQGHGAGLQNPLNNNGPPGQQTQGPHETGAIPSPQPANGGDTQGHAPSRERTPNIASSVDDLIASAARDARPAASEEPPATDANAEKKAKKEKEKDKNTRLVYSDNEVSPEEKMAKLPRYAFVPDHKEETFLAEPGPAVTGVVLDQDDVMDPQG